MMNSKSEPLSEMGKTKESPPRVTSGRRTWAINRLSLVTAGFTFVLIILGALVRNGRGVSTSPAWPLDFGSFVPTAHLSGNALGQYVHRLTAGILSLLVFALFVWILVGERRGWVKWVGALAFVLVLAQAGLGALRIVSDPADAPMGAMAHAFLAQLFLGVVVSLTVFTSPGWVRAGELRSGFRRAPKPMVFFVTTAAAAALVVQVMLGTAYRHGLIGVPPHIAGGVIAGALILWGSILVVRLERDRDRTFAYLTWPARTGVWVLLFQLVVGALAYIFRAGYAANQPAPQRAVATSVIHTGFSAVLLATEVMLLIRLYRMVPITEQPA